MTESVWVRCSSRPRNVNIQTLYYPGFPTDMHPQFAALLCIAEGMGVAHADIAPCDALGNGTFYFADQHAVWEEFRDGSFFRKCFAYFENGTYRGFAELHAATDALEETEPYQTLPSATA